MIDSVCKGSNRTVWYLHSSEAKPPCYSFSNYLLSLLVTKRSEFKEKFDAFVAICIRMKKSCDIVKKFAIRNRRGSYGEKSNGSTGEQRDESSIYCQSDDQEGENWMQWSEETWRKVVRLEISPPSPESSSSSDITRVSHDLLRLRTLDLPTAEKILSLCGNSLNCLYINDIDNCLPPSIYTLLTICCRNLHLLTIFRAKGDTTLLSLLLAGNLQLKYFEVHSYSNLENLRPLNYLPKNLTELCVCCSKLYPEGSDAERYASVIETLLSLHTLQTPTNATILKSIGKLENLRVLQIESYNTGFSDATDDLLNITRLCNLEILRACSLCDVISDKFLVELAANCRNLSALYISNLTAAENVTKFGLMAITSLPKLRILQVRHHRSMCDEVLLKFTKLQKLWISQTSELTSSGIIQFIKQNVDLEHLYLGDCLEVVKILTAAIAIVNKRGSKQAKVLTVYITRQDIWADFNGISEYLEVLPDAFMLPEV